MIVVVVSRRGQGHLRLLILVFRGLYHFLRPSSNGGYGSHLAMFLARDPKRVTYVRVVLFYRDDRYGVLVVKALGVFVCLLRLLRGEAYVETFVLSTLPWTIRRSFRKCGREIYVRAFRVVVGIVRNFLYLYNGLQTFLLGVAMGSSYGPTHVLFRVRMDPISVVALSRVANLGSRLLYLYLLSHYRRVVRFHLRVYEY